MHEFRHMAEDISHGLHHADGAGKILGSNLWSNRSTIQGDHEYHVFWPKQWLHSTPLLLRLCGSPQMMPAHPGLMQPSVEVEDRCEAVQIDHRCCMRKAFQ